MSKHKRRPAFIYREEHLNSEGEWVHSRTTYDRERYEEWVETAKTLEALYDQGGSRFYIGRIHWETPEHAGR